MKILNLYCGIGGNRKLWGNNHEITAVEINPEIAKIYQDLFPNDKVVVADAHEYLLKHYKEFDFIWSSPPCPSHSRMRMLWKGDGKDIDGKVSGSSIKFPDMKLYKEIVFLKHFFDGKYCVENVISYYKPLVAPTESDNHYFWTNFYFKPLPNRTRDTRDGGQREKGLAMGFDLDKYNKSVRFVRSAVNNCVEPETARYILNTMIGFQEPIQEGLFAVYSPEIG